MLLDLVQRGFGISFWQSKGKSSFVLVVFVLLFFEGNSWVLFFS